jgi:uncharacterized coiled-coil DUF342 family protein
MDPKELEARRTALLERIDNAASEEDIDALVAEVDEVRAQIDEYNAKVAKADEARARLRESDLSRPAPSTETNDDIATEIAEGGEYREHVGPRDRGAR